jgi:hypothetical protein
MVFGSPGRSNTKPGLAADGDRVVLSWTTADGDGGAGGVVAAVSGDGGRTFGAPVPLDDAGGHVRTSGDQAPRVAIRGREIAAVWSARDGNRSTVMVTTSQDGGRTFGPARSMTRPGLSGSRGWASIAIDPSDRVHVLWLDGRHAEPAGSGSAGHDHAAHSGQPMSMPAHSVRQDVYTATLEPDGSVAELAVSSNVCFCCKTAIASRPDGSVFLAWRHIFPDSMRDIGSAVIPPDSATPGAIARVSEDRWHLEACPEDGPAAISDRAGTIHVVWPTFDGGQKALFYARSTDGRHFSPRERVASAGSAPGHTQVALAGEEQIAVVWDEALEDGSRVLLRERAADGDAWAAPRVVAEDEGARFPTVAGNGRDVFVAWTAGPAATSSIHLVRIPVR